MKRFSCVWNKCHELEADDYEGMRLMTVGLILVCRREVFDATFYFDSYLYTFAVLCRRRDFYFSRYIC
jgi:hypothetical protein